MSHTGKSAQVTNIEAVPVTKLNSIYDGAPVRRSIGYLVSTSFVGGTAAQTYAVARVPKRAVVTSIKVTNATTTTGSIKLGLFRPNDGIAIDDDVFATNFVLGAANNRAEAFSTALASVKWEDLATQFSTAIGTAGATGDANYDIVASIVTVIGTAKDTLFEVEYVLPE